jgi:hypothetical protein
LDHVNEQAALDYAHRGWPVLALHTPDAEGRCSCGDPSCASPGKHPRGDLGAHDATTDGDVLHRWFARWPDANIGLACGHQFVTVDVDGADGWVLQAQQRGEREQPVTLTALTGRQDGAHLYFATNGATPPGWSVKHDTGELALRSLGSYVVAPPSRHHSGRRYVWEDPGAPLVPLADWQAERPGTVRATPAAATAAPTRDELPRLRAAGEKAMEEELAELGQHPTEPGTRRGTDLYAVACRLGHHIASGGLREVDVREGLWQAADQLGMDEREAERSIDRGLDQGKAEPYVLGGRNGSSPASRTPGGWQVPPTGGTSHQMGPETQSQSGIASGGTLPPDAPGATGSDPRRLDMAALLLQPPRPLPWRCHELVVDDRLTTLTGEGGDGKSWLALALC